MSVATTRRRLVDHWRRITGVQTVFDAIPRALQAAQLPAVVIFPEAATFDTDSFGDEMNAETRTYRMVLYLAEVNLTQPEGQLEIDADPLFQRVKAHFLGHPQLALDNATEPQDSVYNSRLLGDNGFQLGQYPLDSTKTCALIEWRLQVTELEAIAYTG